MKISNPFEMNNWEIRKFLIIVISFQFLVLGTAAIDSFGIKIPILRQLVYFIYLSFIPGILTMRVLKLHKLGCIENLLCAVGLSLSILMFMGLFMNILYPIIGISKPISFLPLISTLWLIIAILSVLSYIIDRDFCEINYIDLNDIFSIPSLFLYLIPLLTILGTYLVNFHQINLLLMIVILLLSFIIFFVNLHTVPNYIYPLAIFVTSISLLFHNSLISMHNVIGWDIQYEYYTANAIITNSVWNSSIYSSLNSMLSIAMLAPIYSILSNLNLTWVFKIIYPAIFSLVPVGMYKIFQRQTNDKIAFMSTFFFISNFIFYSEMLALARQEIAEFFFVLSIFLLIQNRRDISNRTILILFSFSVIISHYGTAYLFVFPIICILVLLFIVNKYLNNFPEKNTITFGFTLLITVFLIAWYIYTSQSLLYDLIHMIRNVSENIVSDLITSNETHGFKGQGSYIINIATPSFLHEFVKYMHLFTQFCISIGLFFTIKRFFEKKSDFNIEYLSFCSIFYILLIAAIMVPNFSSSLNTTRLYHITLILLAPFCIIGGIILLDQLLKRISYLKTNEVNALAFKILSIFFAAFLLFNSGWIYEITNDYPTSYSLSKTVDSPKFNDRDVAGKDWLNNVNRIERNNGFIYADYFRHLLFLNSFNDSKIKTFPSDVHYISRNSYIYLSTYNIEKNEILFPYSSYLIFDPFVSSKNQIYYNGGAKIYYQ